MIVQRSKKSLYFACPDSNIFNLKISCALWENFLHSLRNKLVLVKEISILKHFITVFFSIKMF